MTYLILCGGQYDRWTIPKQLTDIGGEPLVARTIRLLRENGVSDIAISSNDSRFEGFGVPVIQHENHWRVHERGETGYWVDAFPPSARPTCYLFGDVVFSPEAINTIVETDTDGIQFFASAPPFAPNYSKGYAEPFAFKVRDQQRFRKAISYIKENAYAGVFTRHPIAWELWQVINRENPRVINYWNYVAINDYTCDIDRPEDVHRIIQTM